MNQPPVEDIALFFDFENISISLWKQREPNPNFKKIMTWFSQFGRVVLARAYADWASHYKFLEPLRVSGFSPVFVNTYTNQNSGPTTVKNMVDMWIAVEATAVSFNRPNISTFGLLTGDKDYLPLVHHLRSMGKKVIVLAVQDSTAPVLKKAVDLFVPYREMMMQPDGRPAPAVQSTDPIFDLLVEAVKQLKAQGKEPVLARVKSQMDVNLGGFDPKAYKRADGTHYARFLSFVKDAERQGLIHIVKNASDITLQLTKATTDETMHLNGHHPPAPFPSHGLPLN